MMACYTKPHCQFCGGDAGAEGRREKSNYDAVVGFSKGEIYDL